MDEEEPIPTQPKPSRTPSWVMLGFALGALFVLSLPRHATAPASEAAPPPPPTLSATPPKLMTIEDVFAELSQYAVWENDTTEVALWNPDTTKFSNCFEVLRSGGQYYFRSIPRLTRPILTHGVVDNLPLEFTETEKQRQDWLRATDQENMRAISEAVRQSMAAKPPLPPLPDKK